MSRVHANNFVTTLNGNISNSTTSIVLTSVSGFPTIGAGVVAYLTFQNGSNIEIVKATAQSGTTITIVRAQEDTTAQAFVSGSTVSIRPTKGSLDGKADIDSPTFTGTVVLPSTTSIGTVSSTEISYVDGVTSAIQTQIDSKQATISGSSLTSVTVATNDKVLIQDTSDSNNLKTVTAQSVADLAAGASSVINSGTTGQIAYYVADGTTLSGETLVPLAHGGTGATTAAGAAGNLKSCAFSVTLNSNAVDVTGDSTQYVVVWDTAAENVGSNINLSTGIFTAPVTGTYVFTTVIQFIGVTGATSAFVEFLINAADAFVWSNAISATGDIVVGGNIIAKLTSGDTVKVNVSVAGITKIVDIGSAYSRFGGFLLG